MAVRRMRHAAGAPASTALGSCSGAGAALAVRLERAEALQLASSGPPGRDGVLAVADGLAVSKGPRSPSSAAFALGLRRPIGPADLDRVEQHLGAVGGDVRVEVCPQADPALRAELVRRGYRAEGMLRVLSRVLWPGLATALALAAPAPVRVIRRREDRAWAEAFARAHLGDASLSGAAADDLLALARTPGSACFGAFDGGAVVGVAMVSARGGVAQLSGAGVVPAWRGLGLQRALVAARLAWAAERGCDVAASAVVTEGGAPSQRNLERAGFRVAYAKAVMVRRA